jgi:hypothetical protein
MVRELRDAGRAARGHVLNSDTAVFPKRPSLVRAFTDAARTPQATSSASSCAGRCPRGRDAAEPGAR